MLHLEHHRWAGDRQRDPDTPLVHIRMPWLLLALAAPDLVWAWWWATKLWRQRTVKERFAFFLSIGAHFVLVTGFLLSDYSWEFVILYLIPQRLGIMMVAYSFAHIQHPEGVDWQSAPLLSTGVITTKPRSLMTWLLLGQNDHHIHHLLPHLPWHRYRHVWALAHGALYREELAERGLFRGYDEQTLTKAQSMLEVVIRKKELVAEDICALTFEALPNRTLPSFRSGAHIDVHLPSGKIRQYSLCGDPTNRAEYRIAVKKDAAGRGGSVEVHETFREGQRIGISKPKNFFSLDIQANEVVLMAGGIGLTPLLAMAFSLHHAQTPFNLHVFSKTMSQIPFREALKNLPFAHQVFLHADNEGRPSFDAANHIGEYSDGRQLYLCGPAGFMTAVETGAESLGWPATSIFTESFGSTNIHVGASNAFELHLGRTGQTVHVPAHLSIIGVLRNHNIDMPSSCQQGVCGTCVTEVVEGIVEHQDAVLTDDERATHMCPCVSRAAGERLTLNI